ncbi:SKP1/BTB/POZ domain-containing protein [Pacmanvirus A23]|uniref:SKP1/BTB/POZ domain-containing protein n=1 Tax=Pacmanvirus A23 TaxID=1932881 RepID=UPI000A0945FF|nr:SKP1/BTB/POZ domain-containing protein [Pacmanvirus A23]SIP85750.1 SKP1/BTB/POZ domain-containing protein [Pacmanvirus A23]
MSDTQIPGADLIINCSDGKVYYTSYLLQRVPYYNALLNGGFKESNTNEINFKYSVELFKLLVKFIETGILGTISYDNMYKLYKLSLFITYDGLHSEIMKYNLSYRIYYKAVELDDAKTLEKIKKKYSESTCSVNEKDEIRKNIGEFYEFIITKYKKYLYIFDGMVMIYMKKSMFRLALEHEHEYVIIRYIKRKYFKSYGSYTYNYMESYPVEIIGYTIKAEKLTKTDFDSLKIAFIWLKFNPDRKDEVFQYIINNHQLFKHSSFSSLYHLIDMFQDDHEKIKQIIKFELYKSK